MKPGKEAMNSLTLFSDRMLIKSETAQENQEF